ncbi:MAG: 30S ribosomal protein S1 [Candidatus Eisenbacteria sp.]|nr:30S ribosomal protein S1 [Candidatus Eisenbacteria bacterium]
MTEEQRPQEPQDSQDTQPTAGEPAPPADAKPEEPATATTKEEPAGETAGSGSEESRAAPGSDSAFADPPPRSAPIKLVNRRGSEEAESGELDELVQMYVDSLRNLEEGEVLKGHVLKVDESDVLVDIGFKSEGIIPIDEFGDAESIKVGDEIDVFLERIEDDHGLVVLSKQRADFVKVWDRVREAAEKGEVVEGRLVKKIKGGVVVDLFGVEAFLPGSQIALRQPQSIESLMSQTLEFKIIKLNKRRRNIVVSRRLVLEEERERAKTMILKELAVEQIREGYVKNITDFGAFIDLGGIDGLLHITDMSWGRIRHPSEVVSVGDKVKVKVLSFDPERERISLGIKQLTEYPWERVDEKYPVGSKVNGRVVSITEYGAFVELERGVEGLIHISEMSWTKHIRHPSKILSEAQEIECMVLKVDKEHERISLGLKQVEPDPWLTLDERYPVNSIVTGKVRNLTNFGAFVELEDGIDGLVHISDMSWTRRIGHPSEMLKKGDTVTVRVLSLDKSNRRVSLGLKQVQDDPWPLLIDKYPINSSAKGTVAKVIDRGAVVMLEEEVEGFVPGGQLGIEELPDPRGIFREGDELDMKITRVDPANRRILLSVKAWLGEQEPEAAAAYLERFTSRAAEEKAAEEKAAEAAAEGAGPETPGAGAADDAAAEGAQPKSEADSEAPAEEAQAETEPAAEEAQAEPQPAAEGAQAESEMPAEEPQGSGEADPAEPPAEPEVPAQEPKQENEGQEEETESPEKPAGDAS